MNGQIIRLLLQDLYFFILAKYGLQYTHYVYVELLLTFA
jgi:hypothetical protein